jgi:hypothetical protein
MVRSAQFRRPPAIVRQLPILRNRDTAGGVRQAGNPAWIRIDENDENLVRLRLGAECNRLAMQHSEIGSFEHLQLISQKLA